MKKYIQNIIILGILGAFVSSTIVGAQEQNSMDGISTKIKYKYLSNEDIDSFRWHGVIPIYEKGKGRLNEYVRTAHKIRDVRECLILSERNKPTPDIRLIDWYRLGWGSEIDICLFRIFASIGIDQIANWMSYHKMEPRSPQQKRVSRWLKGGDPRTELTLLRLDGNRNSYKYGPLIRGNIFVEWTFGLVLPVRSESISSFWDENGKLMHTGYLASKK